MPAPASPRGTTARLSVAPMMACTDRHFRYLVRGVSRHVLLYTEMVTTGALLHGRRHDLLAFHPDEHPISLQLGGDDPPALAACARMAEEAGFDEVNLNVGCPSDRVASGCFGASLMLRPERVAEGVAAMRAAVALPVTVKHRIGVDALDQYEDMLRFVDIVAASGADRFTVHARKAWLSGLSPKENRTVPPLRHEEVWRLKQERADLRIETNGGIGSLEEARAHLLRVDAVMMGRAVYDDPFVLADADRLVFGDLGAARPTRAGVADRMVRYAEDQLAAGERLHHVTRHMLTLFAGQPGARAYKRHLSTHATGAHASVDVLRAALELVPAASVAGLQSLASPAS